MCCLFILQHSVRCRNFGLARNFCLQFFYSYRAGRSTLVDEKSRKNHYRHAGKSGKLKRLTLQERLEAFRMLKSGSLPSDVMYKFGVSSRFVAKLKSKDAAMLEETEKTAILCNQSPCVEANTRRSKIRCTDSSKLLDPSRFRSHKVQSKSAHSLFVRKFCATTTWAKSNGHKSKHLLHLWYGA